MQMKLFPVRTQALRLPALVLVCLLLVLGAVLGFAVCRAVPQQDRQELSDYLHQYAPATADGRGPSAAALSGAAAYFRYPRAAALLALLPQPASMEAVRAAAIRAATFFFFMDLSSLKILFLHLL